MELGKAGTEDAGRNWDAGGIEAGKLSTISGLMASTLNARGMFGGTAQPCVWAAGQLSKKEKDTHIEKAGGEGGDRFRQHVGNR